MPLLAGFALVHLLQTHFGPTALLLPVCVCSEQCATHLLDTVVKSTSDPGRLRAESLDCATHPFGANMLE